MLDDVIESLSERMRMSNRIEDIVYSTETLVDMLEIKAVPDDYKMKAAYAALNADVIRKIMDGATCILTSVDILFGIGGYLCEHNDLSRINDVESLLDESLKKSKYTNNYETYYRIIIAKITRLRKLVDEKIDML